MKRTVLLAVIGVLAIAAFLALYTPWWFFPGTSDWRLVLARQGRTVSFCIPARDTTDFVAVRTGAVSYWSNRSLAPKLGRFHFRVIPPDDSFWVAQRPLYRKWLGTARIDQTGRLIGESEGLIGVEVREGPTRIVIPYAVVPAMTLTLTPEHPSIPVGGYADVQIDARFSDGSTPPSYVRPRFRIEPWISVVAQQSTTRGNEYAPWWITLHIVNKGEWKTSLEYLGRVVEIAATGVDSAGLSTAITPLGDSIKRGLYKFTPDTARPVDARGLRDQALRSDCLGQVEGLYFPRLR